MKIVRRVVAALAAAALSVTLLGTTTVTAHAKDTSWGGAGITPRP